MAQGAGFGTKPRLFIISDVTQNPTSVPNRAAAAVPLQRRVGQSGPGEMALLFADLLLMTVA